MAQQTPPPPPPSSAGNLRTFHGQPILVGQLPEDFLRIDGQAPGQAPSGNAGHHQQQHHQPQQHRPPASQIEIDQQLAASLQQQYDHQAQRRAQWASQYQAQLVITVVEARLVKNYGLVNMNPYMRIRLGHTIFETKTSHKGGKNPKWNESIRCYLPTGIDTLSLEIYDECMLSSDDLVAWGTYQIPIQHLTFAENATQNTFEETIVLSGKQGDDKEGIVLMVFTIKPITAGSMPPTAMATNQYVPAPIYPATLGPYVYGGSHFVNPSAVIVHQSGEPASALLPGAQPAMLPPATQPIKEEDIKTLQEMFPKIELEVVKSVLTAERGNLDRAINNLLELNSTT